MDAERLSAALVAHTGKTVTVRPAGKPRTHTYSRVQHFTLALPGEPQRRIVVKEPHGQKAADPAAAFAALQTLHRHFEATPDLHSPAPLLALSDPPALVMDAAPGQRFFKILQRSRWPLAKSALDLAVGSAATTGRWLAHLHRLPPPPSARPLPPAPDRLAPALDHLRNSGVDAPWLAGTEHWLGARQTGRDGAPAVTLHGDFTLRNILCAPDGVTALDTELTHHGPAAHDLAYFLASLRFIDRWSLFIGQWLHEINVIETVQQAFLAAYTAEHGPLDPGTLAGHTVGRVLQRWAEYSEHVRAQHPSVGPALAKAADRHFMHVVEEMTAASAR